MITLTLFACSGSGAVLSIMQAEMFATTLGYVSAGIVAFSIVLAWMRSIALLGTTTLAAMLALHPAFWMSALHGDCGSSLRICSTLWTAILGITGSGIIIHAWMFNRTA